jgi:CubicO group peptidase (beta-lactamase class C family)
MRIRAVTLSLALALALGGHGQSSALAQQAPPLTAKQRAEIDRYVKAEMARQRIPGLELGVYRHGKPILEKGYGLANIEWKAKATPDTLMQSGSVGKQFVATAMMMLVEQGKVGLDDSIVKYFPSAPDSWKPILVKNLLSHTSGLAEYEDGALAEPGGAFDLRLDFTDDELLHKIEALPIEYAPGAGWDYRNTNYVLLGFLIRKVTGQFYGDYLHDKIFAPIGMTSTRIISDADIIPGRAAGYEIKGGRLLNQAYVSPTFNRTADGTLYFTVRDLQRWDLALYGEALIKTASLQKMWTPFVLNDGAINSANYGFAWMINKVNDHKVIEHSGAWQGFTTQISRYVDDGVTVVVLTNLDAGHSNPGQIERVVAGFVEPALMPKPSGPIADETPSIAATARRLLIAAAAGADVKTEFAADSGYKFDAADGPELKAALPLGWDKSPIVLLKRRSDKGVTSSTFRIGPAGDTRALGIRTDKDGKVTAYRVFADPDNR